MPGIGGCLRGNGLAELQVGSCRLNAGELTIWDRVFGTFVPEQEAPIFGITRQIHTHNPLTLTFHEWREMLADVRRDRDLRYLWKPPEWRSPRASA